jgi:transposase
MKLKLTLFSLLFIVSCKSKRIENTAVLVESSKVESVKKNRAFDLGTRLLESCNTSRFKPFSKEEATERVIQNATPDKISSTCQKIRQRNGKFNYIKLLDITYIKTTDDYIFRYKIDYEKKYFMRELSVTIDKDNKVSAISTKEIKPKPL